MAIAKRVYFFAGTQYARFDQASNAVNALVYPLDIARWWSGLPVGPIDAALNWGANKVYFFVGAQYYRWNVLANAVDPGYPKAIAGNWVGFAGTGFENGIDAAVNWGNGKSYVFKGNQYLRVDWTTGAVDAGYPKALSLWNGFTAAGFDTDIDAAINFGNGKVYFFKGADYLRYDIATNTTDAGYPKAIAANWSGVFGGGVSAAVEWPYAEVAAGGYRVPTALSACQIVAASGGRNKGGKTFQMQVDFGITSYPASRPVGEYRQFVRGTFSVNGVALVHGLPGASPGDPPRTMLGHPAAGAVDSNFLEDGLVSPPATANVFYGHRLDTAGNTDTTDQYLPDRITGSQYRGTDFPGIASTPGDTYNVALDFLGQAIDVATSGLVLDSSTWSVNCSGTL